jgi:hypothetical protein
MAWHVKGKAREFCSCKMWCPCWIGPAQPDQGSAMTSLTNPSYCRIRALPRGGLSTPVECR